MSKSNFPYSARLKPTDGAAVDEMAENSFQLSPLVPNFGATSATVAGTATSCLPGTTNCLPGTAVSLPGTINFLPGTINFLPVTTSCLPGTANCLPGTSNCLPETAKLKATACRRMPWVSPSKRRADGQQKRAPSVAANITRLIQKIVEENRPATDREIRIVTSENNPTGEGRANFEQNFEFEGRAWQCHLCFKQKRANVKVSNRKEHVVEHIVQLFQRQILPVCCKKCSVLYVEARFGQLQMCWPH